MARLRRRRGPAGPVDFVPSEVDTLAVRREVQGHTGRLAPDAVDEATGHVLDATIDARSAQWLAGLESEYESFRLHTKARRDQAKADLSRLERQRDQEKRHADELQVAREAAQARLRGEQPSAESSYGGPGYSDPALMAGRGLGTFGYVVALVFAICADIAAFTQVISLVMPDQREIVSMILVAGFTAIVVALAHVAGAMLRDRKAGVRWVPAFAAPVFLVAWAGLGLMAAWVRVMVHPDSSSGSFTLGPTPTESDKILEAIPSAATFLALYIGSGLIAGMGAYLTHNRMQSAYRRTVKAHDKAAQRLNRSSSACEERTVTAKTLDNALEAAERTVASQRAKIRAFAEELKEDSRRLIAEKKKDPALTDAITQFELRPRRVGDDTPTVV